MDGRSEGPCTGAFEIICCRCGDDPDLDYSAVSPKLQVVRGPYPIAEGVRVYQAHLRVHTQTEAAYRRGR
jgi:hypothetical protein